MVVLPILIIIIIIITILKTVIDGKNSYTKFLHKDLSGFNSLCIFTLSYVVAMIFNTGIKATGFK